MKLSFGPWGETLDEFVEAGINGEKKGFETLWTSELHRTPFVPLTALATKTSTIKLGSGVALAFLRSPLTLALTAMDLNEISNGRFILGLGSGVKNLNEYWHDVRFGKPVKHIEDVINICRMVIKESHLNPIKYEGLEKSISLVGFDRPFIPKETDIPIYMGSVGPFMTRKCGEIANGWISHELCSPQYLKSNIIPLVKSIRDIDKGYHCPIIFMEQPLIHDQYIDEDVKEKNNVLASQIKGCNKLGFKEIYLIDQKNCLGSDHEATVDLSLIHI